MKFYNILAVILMAFTFKVSATNVPLPSYTGKIKSILTGIPYHGKMLIELAGTVNNPAENCHSNGTFSFSLDTETEQGKLFLSILLTAHASQRDVVMTGYRTCSNTTGVTDFRSIQIK